MIRQHYIGQDFSRKYQINLLPTMRSLPQGMWRIDIEYTFINDGITTIEHESRNIDGRHEDFNVVVGQDVYAIGFRVYRHNSFPGYPNINLHYHLRVDRLIMLNLVCRLIRP